MSLFPLAPFSVPAFEFWILRAFRNADRLTTFKIFRRPPALRRRLAPGQSGRSDRRSSWLRTEPTLVRIDEGRVLPCTGMEDVDLLLVSQRIERNQLLAEIWGGETAEQNVPDKIEGEPEHNRCEPAVTQKKPAFEYVGEIKRLQR